MGRKKAVHPADAYRRAQRKKEIKKNKAARQASRAAGLRKKTEEEIVYEIQKINTSESVGPVDQRQLIRRRQLLQAFNEVQAKKKKLEAAAHKAKTVSVKGLGKLLGSDERQKKEEPKDDALLEFPPGIPPNPKLQRPPGIVPRPQNFRRTRTFLKKKEAAPTARRNFGNVEIVNPHKVAQMNKKELRRKSELFDPLNPASPFYLNRPGQRMANQQQQIQPSIPTAPRPAAPVPQRQIGPQIGPAIGPSIGPAASAPEALGPGGTGAPPMFDAAFTAPYNYPGAPKQKLEVLLSDSMKALVPTSLRVKRKAPLSRRTKTKNLDIAPDVGGAKATKKDVSGKKDGMVVNHAYDAFLSDLGDLA